MCSEADADLLIYSPKGRGERAEGTMCHERDPRRSAGMKRWDSKRKERYVWIEGMGRLADSFGEYYANK